MTHTPPLSHSESYGETQHIVSALSYLALQDTMKAVQKTSQGILTGDIPLMNDELIPEYLTQMTHRFIMARYIELIFQSSMLYIDVKLLEDGTGVVTSRMKDIPGSCFIQFFTDRASFENATEHLKTSSVDTIIAFEELSEVTELQKVLEVEYEKTNRGISTVRDHMQRLFRKLPKEVTKTIGVEFSTNVGETFFSKRLIGELEKLYALSQAMTLAPKKAKKK